MNVQRTPIGVFDSGLGGLSVVHELRAELPRESIRYVADSAYCPYGERSVEFIRARSLTVVDHLVSGGAKLIVVACNTATASALDDLRARYSLPIIGLEPAVKPATALTVTGRIAVLATPRTAGSARLEMLIQRFGAGLDVRVVGMPGLADRIEAGEGGSEEVTRQLREVIGPLVAGGVDAIVLGCTHYPFLTGVVRRIAGPDVRIIDSSNAIARRVRDVLITNSLLAPPGGRGTFAMETSGDPIVVAEVASRLLGEQVQVSQSCLAPAPPAASSALFARVSTAETAVDL